MCCLLLGRGSVVHSGWCLQRAKPCAKQNICNFCVKSVLTATKTPHKNISFFVNPGVFEAIHKMFAAFCENPGSSQNVTPDLCINIYVARTQTKWDNGVVLQHSITSEYSTSCGTRAGGYSCLRNSCHYHRLPHPIEKLLAWSETANRSRQM